MIDLHLINLALAGLGVGAAAVVLIAAAVLAIAAFGRPGRTTRQRRLTHAPASAGEHESLGEAALR